MVNLCISGVGPKYPGWLFLHEDTVTSGGGAGFPLLTFETHFKNRPDVARAASDLCSEFITPTTTSITLCGIDETTHLHRKDTVSAVTPLLPFERARTPMLRVLSNQVDIPGFELCLHFLPLGIEDYRILITAFIVIDDDGGGDDGGGFPTPPFPVDPIFPERHAPPGCMLISEVLEMINGPVDRELAYS